MTEKRLIEIAAVTSTRADYGLLRPLLLALQADRRFSLRLLITGTHLAPQYGLTWHAIESDGLPVDELIDPVVNANSAIDTTDTMSRYIGLFGRVFSAKKPDLLLLLGDRYEMLAIAAAATLHNIPIAHLHGGEVTEGASDDVFRHAISKMSHLHFTSTETHRLRVIQLGENPQCVYNVGALGLDNIHTLPLLDRASLVAQCGPAFGEPYFLVTYHPVTRDSIEVLAQVDQLCKVLLTYSDTQIIITGANADSGGDLINQRWLWWQANYPEKIQFHYSLGQLRYLSAMKYALAVVGNSSSGIIEAPSMHIATLDIGKRQHGRTAAESVLHVDDTEAAILTGLQVIQSACFQQKLPQVMNPYGDGRTTERIISILAKQSYPVPLIKPFFDLPVSL